MKKILETLKQKWTEYFLEIIVIIIGVLGAFTLNNWNEQRKYNNEESAYLQGLKADLILCNTELDRVIKKTKRVDSLNEQMILFMHGQIEISDSVFNKMLFELGGYTIFMTYEGTINEIIGSGKLSIFRDIRIRRAISSWDADIKQLREFEIRAKDARNIIREYLRKRVDYTEYIFDKDFRLNERIKSEILKSIEFRNTLYSMQGNSETLNKFYIKRAATIDSLLTIINHE